MRYLRRLLNVVCLMLILCSGCHDVRKADVEVFNKGNASYKKGDYQAAIKQYQEILDSGLTSEVVYFNLGNAFFKSGELGRAIVNYERALRQQPRDGDLKANLAFAQSMIKTPEPQTHLGIFIHLQEVTLDEIIIILLMLGITISGLFLAGLFLKWRFRKTIFFMSLLTAVFIFHIFALFTKIDDLRDRAIVLSTVDVKYEPEDMATTHFVASEGWKVRVLKEGSGWVKVERSDGLEGWVPKGKIEKI